MSEVKHTPGPWEVIPSEQIHRGRVIAVVDGGRETIAEVYCGAFDGHARDNAALIAAAPDLLAAAERALVQLRDVNPHPVRTIEALEAAIAKAKGGGNA